MLIALSTTESTSPNPIACSRKETGYLLSAQITWAYRQFYRLFAKYESLSNKNEQLKEFSFEQQSFLGGITLAFPSVKRTVKYSERFADRALSRGLRP